MGLYEEKFEHFKNGEDLAELTNCKVSVVFYVYIGHDTFNIFYELFLNELMSFNRNLGLLSLHLLLKVDSKHLSGMTSFSLLMLPV